MSATTSTAPPQVPTRVPAEHRLLGLDKRSFPYALAVVGVFLVLTVGVPLVDRAIAWDDPVRAGEQLGLTDTVAFTPATGWNVESGFRLDPGSASARTGPAVVTSGGVVVQIVPDTFDGTPSQLLRQIAKVVDATGDKTFAIDGEPATVTTPAGDVGVIQSYSSITGDGLIAAFVIDGKGLEVTAYGPPTQMRAAAPEIDAMIASIASTEGSAS